MPRSKGKGTDLGPLCQTWRRWIIEQSLASNVGHIGSALSIVEITAALWESVMRDPGTQKRDRDRFILGKGHAALTLYCALRSRGIIDEKAFRTYCGEGSLLGAHPEAALPGVDVSTGSLGQGLSIGAGLAFGLRNKGLESRVWALLSDAECNEGQVWEAAMFGAQHHLGNLTVVVDLNGCQAMGHTKDVLDLTPMADRWKAFGWEALDCDGHDAEDLAQALAPRPVQGPPRAVIARTILGKGIPYMENKVEWHYRNLTPDLAKSAIEAIGRVS